MKKPLLLSLLIAISLIASAQRIQRTTGDTIVIDSNNNLRTTPLTDHDYGVWRKVSLYGNQACWQQVTNTPWRVFAYGEVVRKGKRKYHRICVCVVDSNGVSIPDAIVKYKNKTLKYDPNELAYITTAKKHIQLSVEYDGIKRNITTDEGDYTFYDGYYNKASYFYRNKIYSTNPSWIVTDKNLYRPGDTIRWKVVGVDESKGKIMANKPVEVYIASADKRTTVFKGNLNERGTAFGAALVDTLKLTANSSYPIMCSFTNRYFVSTNFYYKDYELKDVVATAGAEKQAYAWGDTVRITVTVNDEKGDYVDNGTFRCQLYISSLNRIYQESLWYDHILTDTLSAEIHHGTAEILVPTAQWLKADYNVNGTWLYRSADGTERNGNNISFSYQKNLPQASHTEPTGFFEIKDFHIFHTTDSVGFSAVAPRNPQTGKPRPFHWVIYRNKKLFDSGVDTLLNWRRPESADAKYYCFISGDSIDEAALNIRHSKNDLNVSVSQRTTVLPGSVDEITVRVTDSKGKPVAGVDVTALGYTKKLGRNLRLPASWASPKRQSQSCHYIADLIDYDDEPNGTDLLKEQWLIDLLRADSVQYWQLVHNTTGKVRIIRSHSSVRQPQVVPVLVNDSAVEAISRLDIDHEQAWVTGTSDRYSFALRNGKSHSFTFYVGDTSYTAVVDEIAIDANEKAWLSIPKSVCTKSVAFGNRALANQDIESRRIPVSCYPVNGIGYLRNAGSDSLVRPLTDRYSVLSRIPYSYSGIDYYEMRLDGPTAKFPFNLDLDAVSYYSADRMLIASDKCKSTAKKLTKKQLKKVVAEVSYISLDDSLCTTAQLHDQWVASVDSRRARNDIHTHFQPRTSTTIRLLYANVEERPINLIYRAVGDTVEYIVGANSKQNVYVSPGKRYELTFLYKDARVRTIQIDVRGKGFNVVKASLDSSMTTVRNANTIALEDSVRHLYESQMVDGEHYSPASGVYDRLNSYEANEVMVVAYGTARNRMMAMAAAPKAESIRIRGIGSVNSYDYDMMDETSSYEMAADSDEDAITIRDNFSDVAFWEPDLVTDRNGEVRFAVTYPDDLTNWQEAFVAIKGRQRGSAKSNVVARKDEVATLKMPRFAVAGDTVSAIGNGVNYVTGASRTDTLHAVAVGDSLCMQYVFGHDGERRCSPIYPQGMEARDANFHILDGDTSFTLKYNKTISSPMEVNVYTDIREALLESVESLAKSDWCGSNDYLALRLQAMLMVADSDYTKEIDQVEKKLLANRMENGFWCWYGKCGNTGSSSLWVTHQVLTALGPKAEVSNYFLTTLGSCFIIYRNQRDWSGMFDVAKVFDLIGDTVQRNIRLDEIPADSLAKYDRSALIEYQMMRNEEVRFDTMRHRTYTGGEYYSLNPKRRCCWFNPVYEQIETSLLAYRYYTAKGDAARCRAIKLWLMQYVRNRGRFGISLSESLSLKIVKALWQDDKIGLKDLLYQLSIDDRSAYELPYATTVQDDAKLEYSGKRTLYVSTEQKYWDEDPDVVSNGMSIKSEYLSEKNNRGIIKVDVNLEADAEYLVISIPIPAGCSYDDQGYSYTRGESHREEYKDRVNIFCERIGEGTHHFEVRLNERYPGVYTVNPSEVHLIYFPSFNANTKKTKVKL